MHRGRYRDSEGSFLFIIAIERGRCCLHLFTPRKMLEKRSPPLIFRMLERSKRNNEENEAGRFCLQEFCCKSPYLVGYFLGDLPFFIQKIAYHLACDSKMVAELTDIHLGFFIDFPEFFYIDDFAFLFL